MKQKWLVLLLGITCLQISCKRKDVRREPSAYDYHNVGASGKDMLRSDTYTALDVQIQYMPGYKLEPETIKNITALLERVCDKPRGINVSQSQVNLSADTVTIEKVMEIEKRYRMAYTGNNTLVLYVLITNGYSDKGGIAAYSYYNTSIVVFGKMITKFASLGKAHMETFLMTHELGHIMGLTNMGTALQTPHEDNALIHHCTNPTCAMNQGSSNTELDSMCLKDLEAVRKGSSRGSLPHFTAAIVYMQQVVQPVPAYR